jgi:5'-3' exonuclease
LYRDTPEFIQTLDSTLSSNDQYYLDIPAFACSLEAVMRETTKPRGGGGKGAYVSDSKTVETERNTTQETTITRITSEVIAAIDDYIVMAFMLGNDFMPHFPSLNLRTNGMTVLLQTYATMFRESKEYLVKRNDVTGQPMIVWKTMRAFIALLAETEHNRFMNEHKLRDRQSKQRFGGGGGRDNGGNKMGGLGHKTATDTVVAPAVTVDIRDLTKIACNRVVQMVANVEQCHSLSDFMLIPMQERAVERYIDPYRENWEHRYYDVLFDIDIYAKSGGGIDWLQSICVNYIEGLEWTMRYYSTGCVDWRWTYKYPYAPLFVDLMRFMPHLDTALFPNTAEKNPVRDIVQLCYVLPMASHGLLPPAIAEKLRRSYSHYYCDKLKFKWSYCKYFWEAHTELPHIRISELERVVAGV